MRVLSIIVILCLLGSTPALATGTQVAEPSARETELSRRYFELMQSDQLEDVIRAIVSDDPAMTADMTVADREFLLGLSAELTVDMMPQMMEALVPVYASTFSEAELEAMIGFFDTEMGRSIIAKTFSSLPEVNAAMMSVMPQLMDKMATRLCARYGCNPDDVRDEMYQGAGIPAPNSAPRARTK